MMEVDTTSSMVNNIMMMEVDTGNSRPLEVSTPVKEGRKHPENKGSNTTVFINHGGCFFYELIQKDHCFFSQISFMNQLFDFVGLISWNESRRKWIGDQSQRSQRERTPEDPVIRFNLRSNLFFFSLICGTTSSL